ncbi:MAG: choice-of-anchor D domain-containing protein [Granulosicoccus sp.]
MVYKLLVWSGNVFMASLLVLLVSFQQVSAQDNPETTAASSGQISIPLSGTGTVSTNSSLSIVPSKVDAGLVEVGQSSNSTFTLKNTGGVGSPAISILDVELFGKSAHEFATDFNGFITLGGDESQDVTVNFTPLTPGDKAAGIRLKIAGATTPYVVLFTANARYPLTSDLSSSTNKVEFGQALQNSTAKINFTLKNDGEAGAPSINVSAIQISGTNSGDFSLDFTPTTLAAGQQMNVQTTLQTGTQGFKSAEFEVFHDGNNGSLEIDAQGTVITGQSVPVNFTDSVLATTQEITRGTSIQFGPDNRLYVAEMDGLIHVFNVNRNGPNNYSATLFETIGLIKAVPNHNDDGTTDWSGKRLLTGIHVVGTAAQPVIYAASSDPRQAAGPSGNDSGLDTNSGILHKLTRTGGTWNKQDLVRGLPRSEENHVSNGLVLVGNKIYLNVGGHTNQGSPSNNFAELSEYALSAATLVIDLAAIGNTTYDLPTLDGPADQYDPFGGHDGLNQAKLVAGGPVQIFASGLRNAYDIVYTESGQFYVWDNGSNTSWGGSPNNTCLNTIDNGGNKYPDGLHLISQGYYAGHPNPTRGNKANTFGGQSPVEVAENPEECTFKIPGKGDGSLTTNIESTNGMVEYTASNFSGSMKGNLIAAAFGKKLYRVELANNGTVVQSKSLLKDGLGTVPLDVTAQGDTDIFPGTIWVVDNIAKTITVLEPSDY